MTAMCDVAFLLLAFFILTTKFKPSEALSVVTPKSVSTKKVNEKDQVLVTIDKDGKVYFSLSDDAKEEKATIIEYINEQKKLGLSDDEKKAFERVSSYVGVPFSQLKSYLAKSKDELKGIVLPGIPVMDTLNNELAFWMRAATTAYQGSTMNLLVKGDNKAKYPAFKGVIEAFKTNDLYKFQMVTDPEGVPAGTELWKKANAPAAAAGGAK